MPNPACQVKNGGAAYVGTTNGVTVTPANTIIIQLIDSSADTWGITCVTSDDQSVPATINAGLVIDSVARTATFTAPVAGRALRFRSVVNGGIGADGKKKSSYTTYFGIYTLTADGLSLVAADETTERDATYGWAKSVNAKIRQVAGGGNPNSVANVEKAANYTVTTSDFSVVVTTATGTTITLPASPANGASYEIKNYDAAVNLTVNGGGTNIDQRPAASAATDVIPPGASRIYRYSSTTNVWMRFG